MTSSRRTQLGDFFSANETTLYPERAQLKSELHKNSISIPEYTTRYKTEHAQSYNSRAACIPAIRSFIIKSADIGD